MNDRTIKALDRALDRLEEASAGQRRRGGFSTAPVVLTLGLILGYQLLVRFVPMAWAALLPGGLQRATTLPGWPGLVGYLAVFCHQRFKSVLLFGALVSVSAFVVSAKVRPLRALVWIAAIAVILLDAGIIYVVLGASMSATLQDVGAG